MNINLSNFNVKNFIKEAGHSITRAVQLTEEKLGTTERTEYDGEFHELAEHADVTKVWTEKILKDTEAVLVPNPQNRVEDYIYEKFDKSKRHRLSNLEHLALDMLEAGSDFGQDLPYGQALIKVGQAEQKLGCCERDFIGSSSACFTEPLRKFLDGEIRTITKERGILESKRLDLDACKNRAKKARNMLGQQTKDGVSPEIALEQAERDLRVAQSEFDCQLEITKTLLDGISTSHDDHLRHLYAFVGSQVRYFKECMDVMSYLQNELANLGGPIRYVPLAVTDEPLKASSLSNGKQAKANPAKKNNHNNNTNNNNNQSSINNAVKYQGSRGDGNERRGITTNLDDMRRARVLCSYDAKDHTELTLTANEVIFVSECSPPHPDYMYGKQGLLKGLVPRVFLEMLDQEDVNEQPASGDSDY